MDCVIEKALKAGNGEEKGREGRENASPMCVLRFIRDVFHFLSFSWARPLLSRERFSRSFSLTQAILGVAVALGSFILLYAASIPAIFLLETAKGVGSLCIKPC